MDNYNKDIDSHDNYYDKELDFEDSRDIKKRLRHHCHYIVKSQSKVSHCEADLFCTVTERFKKEIRKDPCFESFCEIVNLINDFLLASASKEKSIASVIRSCNCTECSNSNKGC